MAFEFSTAGSVRFGVGAVRDLPRLGRRALIVTGRNSDRAKVLDAEGVVYAVSGEPTISAVEQGIAVARRESCDWVIGFGGGSAIDAGKAIAALLANPGEVLDYLEVVGRSRAIANPSVPYVAIPTTAGTGSEVTRNAVIGSPEHRVKASLRSPYLLPQVAIVDPELTLGLPSAVTASTGLDALTQLIEPFVSRRANPLTDAVCREGIPRAARALRRAFHHPEDLEARTGMALASLMGGMALANAGLGAVHGFAAPIGGMFHAPHGAVCAALLPGVVEANRAAVPDTGRFDAVAGMVGVEGSGLTRWLRDLVDELEIPALRAYGITAADVPEIVEKAEAASSMKANPVTLSKERLAEILHRAM